MTTAPACRRWLCRTLTTVAASLVASGARAQAGETVVVEQRVLLDERLTPAAARRRALVSTMAESAAGTQSAYRSVVQLDAAGRAVDARVLSESWETTRVPELGQQVYYRATFAITVEHEQGTPDAAFAVDLTLPRTEFVAHSADPRQNDELVAAVRVTQSAQLWLFSVAGDSVHLLIPNEYQAPVEATADARLELPDATWRSRGLRLRVSLPAGSERQDELLTVVALRGPARASARHMTLLEFQRWLVRIPAGQRAVGFAPYSVRLAIH